MEKYVLFGNMTQNKPQTMGCTENRVMLEDLMAGEKWLMGTNFQLCKINNP